MPSSITMKLGISFTLGKIPEKATFRSPKHFQIGLKLKDI